MRDFFARFPHLPAFSLFEVRRYNFYTKIFFITWKQRILSR
jgi:hypothetical protein